jgi:hypothetical protein
VKDESALETRQYDWLTFTADGFALHDDPSSLVRWSDILQVAYVFYIDLMALDSGYYWAMRTARSNVLVVSTNEVLERGLRQRFDLADLAAPNRWRDEDKHLQSFTVWPPSRVGRPLGSRVPRGFADASCGPMLSRLLLNRPLQRTGLRPTAERQYRWAATWARRGSSTSGCYLFSRNATPRRPGLFPLCLLGLGCE